jgi:MoxR-like ATPase
MSTDPVGMISIEQVADFSSMIVREVEKAIVGKRDVGELAMAAILCPGGHLLLEDRPGLAKTLLASSFSKALGLDFKRIRLSPDLVPEDIVGGYAFVGGTGPCAVRKGPIFAQLLLAEEINRASPQIQSVLLEAMQEGQVVLEGESLALPRPFIVVATQNPIELEDSIPLSESQLDRFVMKLSVGYPLREEEEEILRRRVERRKDAVALNAIVSPEILLAMREAVEKVHVDPDIRAYIVAIAECSRGHPRLAAGVSPRGSVALLKLARAWAAMQGRDFVAPEDVKRLASPALSHRVALDTRGENLRVSRASIIDEIVRSAPAPSYSDGSS